MGGSLDKNRKYFSGDYGYWREVPKEKCVKVESEAKEQSGLNTQKEESKENKPAQETASAALAGGAVGLSVTVSIPEEKKSENAGKNGTGKEVGIPPQTKEPTGVREGAQKALKEENQT